MSSNEFFSDEERLAALRCMRREPEVELEVVVELLNEMEDRAKENKRRAIRDLFITIAVGVVVVIMLYYYLVF